MTSDYTSEVHRAAQLLAIDVARAGCDSMEAYHRVCDANEAVDGHMQTTGLGDALDDLDTANAVTELADAVLADDSTIFGLGLSEAVCDRCGETFIPNGDESVRVTAAGSVLFEHFQRADETDCGGFGPLLGSFHVRAMRCPGSGVVPLADRAGRVATCRVCGRTDVPVYATSEPAPGNIRYRIHEMTT